MCHNAIRIGTADVGSCMKYVVRTLERKIAKASNGFPVIAVTGARQTGKSTMLRHLFKDYAYISFDDPILRRSAMDDPALFMEGVTDYTILDEIQYVPEILPYIKMRVDTDYHGGNALFVLTGSQHFVLMKDLTETLAGRIALFELLPFSFQELNKGRMDMPSLFEHIFRGFYPLVAVHNADSRVFYSSYVQTYLERDIRQVTTVKDLTLFQHFLEVLATRAGSVLNVSEVSRICGISHTTGRNWLSMLESSGVIYLLRPYFRNISKRVVKSPKLYFTDTGLLAYLLKYQDSTTLRSGPFAGHIFENFVVMEVYKEKSAGETIFDLYYFRDSHKNEIDLIVEKAEVLKMFEIKMRKNIGNRDTKVMDNLDFPDKTCERFLVSFYEHRIPVSRRSHNIPWWDVVKAIG